MIGIGLEILGLGISVSKYTNVSGCFNVSYKNVLYFDELIANSTSVISITLLLPNLILMLYIKQCFFYIKKA